MYVIPIYSPLFFKWILFYFEKNWNLQNNMLESTVNTRNSKINIEINKNSLKINKVRVSLTSVQILTKP